MGFNTVAVILNDQLHRIKDDGRIGAEIASAVNGFGYNRDREWSRFTGGEILSCAHADGYQVVVVHGNTGCTIDKADNLGWMALDQMKECLERHGYRVTKRRKPLPTPTAGDGT